VGEEGTGRRRGGKGEGKRRGSEGREGEGPAPKIFWPRTAPENK